MRRNFYCTYLPQHNRAEMLFCFIFGVWRSLELYCLLVSWVRRGRRSRIGIEKRFLSRYIENGRKFRRTRIRNMYRVKLGPGRRNGLRFGCWVEAVGSVSGIGIEGR